MINANVCKEWQRLLTTRQLKDGRLHMGGCGVEGTHFKTLRIGGLSGMNRARIDENHPAGWCEMLCAFMCKRLQTSFNETNNVVIVAVTWIRVMNVISL